MKKLVYKGISFDDYAQDENGHFWATMCEKHVTEHKDALGHEIDDGNHACGTCSVDGCECDAECYIDFEAQHVHFETGAKND